MAKKKSWKDLIKRIITIIIFWAFLWYLWWIFLTKDVDKMIDDLNEYYEMKVQTVDVKANLEEKIQEETTENLEKTPEVVENNDSTEEESPIIYTKKQFFILSGSLVLISLYFIIIYGICSRYVPWGRLIATVLGIFVIMSSRFLPNSWTLGIFLGDIVSVLGFLIIILYPTNVFMTEKIKENKAKSEEIVIEA